MVQKRNNNNSKTGLNLNKITPATPTQGRVFEAFKADKHLLLTGEPGTGKTLISVFLSLQAVIKGQYSRLIIVRSAVPSRNLGFLPGNTAEKGEEYEAPYVDICQELFGRQDAYNLLKQHGQIKFITTSFIRGLTLRNSIILLDEFQNCTEMELHSIITRIGENSRLLLVGDSEQDDLSQPRGQQSGFRPIVSILNKMKSVESIHLGEVDILRSEFVKEYIKTRNENKIQNDKQSGAEHDRTTYQSQR